MTHDQKRQLVDPNAPISLSRQAELFGISRSGLYYTPRTSDEERLVMNAIDEIYTERPFYGNRRIREDLKTDYAIMIGRKRVRTLMQKMGLCAIYPKPNTSKNSREHSTYPYLLRRVSINHPNHVWGTDITYIRLKHGFIYLTAILDWFSRYVVSWKLSETLETGFCMDALTEALRKEKPHIHNSDQGVQYTSDDYIGILKQAKVKISMDGKGRYLDNIFTERLWRTVKYENIFLKSYETIRDAQPGLTDYFQFYNEKRKHQSLGYKTPQQIYYSR